MPMEPTAPQPTPMTLGQVTEVPQQLQAEQEQRTEAMHAMLLGLVNYKAGKTAGFSDEDLLAEAKRRLDKQAGLFAGQLNPGKGLAMGFTYKQLLDENDRRLRARGQPGAMGETEQPGWMSRGFSAAKDFFVPPNPDDREGVGDTAGQLALAPFRLNNKFSEFAGGQVAEKLPLLAPNNDLLPYVAAGLGVLTEEGTKAQNYMPNELMQSMGYLPDAAEAVLPAAADAAKPAFGRLGELLNTPVPGKAGALLDDLAASRGQGLNSFYAPSEIAAQGKDLASLGGGLARGVARGVESLWQGKSGMSQGDILAQVAQVQKDRQLEPQTIDDLNNYTVREQLAKDVGESAARVSNDFRPAFWDELKAMRANPENSDEQLKAMGKAKAVEIQPSGQLPGTMAPQALEETGGVPAKMTMEPPVEPGELKPRAKSMIRDPDAGTTKILAQQQALKQSAAGRLKVGAIEADQDMTALLQDPQTTQAISETVLNLPEHVDFPGWAPPIQREVPLGTGLGGRLKATASNVARNTAYAAAAPLRASWALMKQYFADPSAVLPRLAYETGRAYERMSHTRSLFMEEADAVIKTLGKDERLAVAAMLDSHQHEWLKNEPLMQILDAADKKVLPGQASHMDLAYQRLRKVLDKLAEVEGLEQHQKVSEYFPHIDPEGAMKNNPNGIAVPDLGIYAKATQNRFHLAREGMKGYSLDLADVLNVRISTGLRKAYLNPVITAFEPRFAELPRGVQDYADLYVRRLQGRPGGAHEFLDETIRKMTKNAYNVGDLTRGQVYFTMMYYRGLLGLGFDTAFKNLGQVQNTIATVGFRNTAKGAIGLLSSRGRSVMAKAGVAQDYEKIVEASANVHSSFWGAMDKVLFTPMRFSEYINRGVAFHGGLVKAYEEGLEGQQALNFAKHVVDKTQFRYGVTNTSPYLQNPLGKMLYQFGSYPLKELQFMEEVLHNKDMAVRMLALHGMVYGAHWMTGSSIDQAFGQEEWQIPLTGNKRLGRPPLTVNLPTAMATHFLNYTAPIPKLVGEGMGAAFAPTGSPLRQQSQKAFVHQAVGLVPASRYGLKLYGIYKKVDAHYDAEKKQVYSAGDAGLEAVGIAPQQKR